MKKITNLICLLIIISLHSQTHRFIYELQLKMDSTDSDYQKFNMILDINSKEVKFYGRNLFVADSINKKFGNMDNKHVDMTGQIVKRKINTFNNENFINIKFGYYSYKTNDKITWNISKETKQIQDYTLQKATAKFGGRDWIAWFNKDIPFNEGPFKFSGLPGLIFEIYDTKKNFIYNLIKSQELPSIYPTDDFLESNFGNKAIPITEKQKQKLSLEFYNDPFSFERTNFSKTNNNLNININGKEIHTIDELNSQTKNMQEIIKKYNNPIEIDKAIHYKN
ncbi:GLPGLI family protein [Chryseobacterium soldanellicola]|uniref:GLPGLI family protein n=1 Tax=Chryseobacterium soldanellicola TaxID=311333 RepID=A0A1H0XRJ1_9FLAO|nr:GLPGLI family protein [Chryseobacterium soldanellicola]SDQ05542.1 GLPGLI family protein [Chryseobacterium soldanellicola]